MTSAPPRPPASNCPDTVIRRSDAAFPAELLDLGDAAPEQLFVRGSLELLAHRPRVAIVGTRRATAYGLRVTAELTRAFVRAGACIVSGLATGIDGMAHQTALAEAGITIAVLGTGLDNVYPRAHRVLQRDIGERGVLLTELGAAEHGMRFTFLHRNRIIAALATTVIVVEAPEHSGALDTAEHAFDLNRVVGSVPGPIDQPQSAGTNALLSKSALVVGSVEDALMMAKLTPAPRVPRGDPQGDEGRVWSALAHGPLDIDTLCHRSALPAAQCLAAVTKLELAGSIECALTGAIRRR